MESAPTRMGAARYPSRRKSRSWEKRPEEAQWSVRSSAASTESGSGKGAALVARGLSPKLGLGLVFVRMVDEGLSGEKMNAIAERLERLRAPAARSTPARNGWSRSGVRPNVSSPLRRTPARA